MKTTVHFFAFILQLALFLTTGAPATAQETASGAPSEPIATLTRYDVKPAFREQFRAALLAYTAYAAADAHNLMAEAYSEENDPAVYWVIERWDDKTAAEKAGSSPHQKTIRSFSEQALLKPARVISVTDLEPLTRQQWRAAAAPNDTPLVIMLFVDAVPGTENAFREIYHTAMPQFRSEPGVITYQLSQLREDGTQFVTFEKFRGEDAFQYHLAFPPIQPVIDYLNTSIKQQPFQTGLHRLLPLSPVQR